MKTKELVITKQISPVVAQVQSMKIASPKDMETATSVLSQLKKFDSAMTTEKEKLTKPITQALTEVRSRYKPTELILDEAITTIKKKMSVYQTAMFEEQRKEEQKIADRVAKGSLKPETAVRKMGEMEVADAKVFSDHGSVSFRTTKKFEVVDIVQLCEHDNLAVLPNDVYIRTKMKEGLELPGVRYYEEQTPISKI